MRTHSNIGNLGTILERLARISDRPRYAFLVLQLVAEAADERGRAGPWIASADGPMLVRDWLCIQLLPLSEQATRRSALRQRVVAELATRLSGDPGADEPLIETAVAGQVRAAGRTNVSRAITDLVRAGLIERFYVGYATNHTNRGGGRHAVYALTPEVWRSPGQTPLSTRPRHGSNGGQGELFAAL